MMKRRLVVEFTKMNGAGNDFVIVDNRFYHFSDEELIDLARRLCRRRFGIGADGLLAFSPPREEGHDYRMRYVNADGSVGTMCGNGARCLARFAHRAGLTSPELIFETDAGVFRARVPAGEDAPVRIYLGAPRHFAPERSLPSVAETLGGDAHAIWTGTEHLVCFVEDVASVPVAEWGLRIRSDADLAPVGANVDFVQVAGSKPARLIARTFEKGVEDETFACGTGAVAAAVVARLLNRVAENRVDVEMPGGRLVVGFEYDDGEISELYLEGPAEVVYRGTVEV